MLDRVGGVKVDFRDGARLLIIQGGEVLGKLVSFRALLQPQIYQIREHLLK
jgi:hypothetical protein